MSAFPVTAHGVCLAFAYHLFGDKTELNVAIQRPGSQGEVLWKVWSSEGNVVWKHGRVSLGVSLQFRVRVVFLKKPFYFIK